MFLRPAPTKSLVLLDFLAPSLISRSVGTSAGHYKRTHSGSTRSANNPAVSPTILNKVQDSIIKKYRAPDRDLLAHKADTFNDTIHRVHNALDSEDAETIRQCWDELKRLQLCQYLGAVHLRRISALVVSAFLPSSMDESCDEALLSMVEEVAVAAALSRITDGVIACMLYHIQRNQPDAVLRLYDACRELMEDSVSWKEKDEEQLEYDDLALSPEHSLYTAPHTPGRVYILLSATTAHVMRNEFQEALTRCQGTVVRFHHYTTKDFVAKLKHDRMLQKKVDLCVNRLKLARLVSRPPSLSRQIVNLGESREWKTLKKLYDGIIEGISGPDPYIAAEEALITSQQTVAMTEVAWTSFITAFSKCHREDLVSMLWEDIPKLGLRHTTVLWNALMEGQSTSFSAALSSWSSMISQGAEPDALTYRALIQSLFNGQRPNLAMERFRKFQVEIQKSSTEEHVLTVYNTVLHGLLKTNRVDMATSLLDRMKVGGPKPDVISYNTFLGHFSRRNDLKGVGRIITEMAGDGMPGDIFSYSTILTVLLRLGRHDALDVVFRLMDKHGVKANAATYTSIIDHQMREQDHAHLNGALNLLSRMEADANNPPNQVTYTAILAGIHRGQWLSFQEEKDLTRNILQRMKQREIKLNTTGYNTLIRACLENDRPQGVQRALDYYRAMKRANVPMFQQTWCILLSGLIARKEWAIAKEIVRDMEVYNVQPYGLLVELRQQVIRKTRGLWT